MAVALQDFKRVAGRRNEGEYKPVRLSANFESVNEPPADEATLLDFAPIFGVKDNAAGIALVQKIISTPNIAIAELQADDLAPVWSALEKADKDIVQMDEPGRADIPFESGKLHALSLDIAKYLNVVQTQLPVIMPELMSHVLSEKMRVLVESLGVKTLACELRFVRGAQKEVISRINTDERVEEERESRFGFMTIRSREPSKSKAIPYEEKLLALPVLTIDKEVLAYVCDQPAGEGILRDLQHIVGIINHDYFHHLTARIVNPYFLSAKYDNKNNPANATIDLFNTPFAQLLDGKLASKADFDKEERDSYFQAMKAERQMPFYNDHYRPPMHWNNLFGEQSYEFHALHLHRKLYLEHLDGGPHGQEMRQRLDSMFAALKNLQPAPERGEPHNLADITKLYFSALVYSNLLRIVTHDHPIAQQCEKLIDSLDISPALLEREREARAARAGMGRNYEVDSIVGPDNKDSQISAGEQLRRHAYIMNSRDTNYIHMKEWKNGQDNALPAMRFYLSAVQRDIQLAKWRGGPEALDATRNSINRDKPEPV